MPSRRLAIVSCGFGRRLGPADSVDLGVGKLLHGKRLTIAAREALMLVCQRHFEALPTLDAAVLRAFAPLLSALKSDLQLFRLGINSLQ